MNVVACVLYSRLHGDITHEEFGKFTVAGEKARERSSSGSGGRVAPSNSQSSLSFDSEVEFAAELRDLGVQAALALNPSLRAGSEMEV